jgi:hypothetical protein
MTSVDYVKCQFYLDNEKRLGIFRIAFVKNQALIKKSLCKVLALLGFQ